MKKNDNNHPIYAKHPAPKPGDQVRFYRQGCVKPGVRLIDRVFTDENGKRCVHIVKTGKKPDGVSVLMHLTRPVTTSAGQSTWEYRSFNR